MQKQTNGKYNLKTEAARTQMTCGAPAGAPLTFLYGSCSFKGGIMNLLKNHMGTVLVSVIAAVIGAAFGVIPYFAVAHIITLITEKSRNFADFIPLVQAVAIGLIGALVFHSISTLTSHNLAFRVIEYERKRLAAKLSRLSMGSIEKKSSGQWAQFTVETLDKLERPIAHVIPEVIANVLIPIVLVTVIFIQDWKIGVANLVSLPVGILFSFLMMGGYEEKSKAYQNAAKNMNTAAVEYIHGINLIKAFNRSASSYGKFRKAVDANRDSMLNWYLSVCFYMTAAGEIIPATLVFVLPVSLYLFMHGTIQTATLVMCVLLAYASYKPLIKAMVHMDTMANLGVLLGEIKSVMDMPELERGTERQKLDTYSVSFDHVSFGYNENENVFSDLNFSAEEKKLTAIVGPSGSGKSTIAKLIAGFWNAGTGDIRIGSVRLRDMPLEQNMEAVTYVSQENFLFDKSIIENMRMAKENASIEEVQAACKKAGCHDFIMSLPDGYETRAGEAGSSFSGGERQRITIARALLKDSPVVVLDEATAYSDPENEAHIQKSIDALVQNKTVIMIAHRLSTIVHADKIIVIDKGAVQAQGTHDELLKTSALYQSMWASHIRVKNGGTDND